MKCARLRAELVLAFALVLLSAAACKRNHPPSVPDVTGRLAYRPGDTARLSATSTDEDDDSLSYLFAWVDSASSVWSPNYANGVPASASHLYASPDSHAVRVRAKDTKGAESDWSAAETLRVGIFVPGTPALPEGPSSWETADTYRCSTHATSPYGEAVRIEYDWGRAECDTFPPVPSDSPCIGTHVYYYPGTYYIAARARDTTGLVSAWSDSRAVTVVCHDSTPPAVSIVCPADSSQVREGLVEIRAAAADDQIVARVEFTIDGIPAGTDSVAGKDTFSYGWTDTPAQVIGRSYMIAATAFDAAGNQALDTISITIIGHMRWCWQNPNEGSMQTSAIVADDGAEEVVMSYCWEDFNFYSVRAGNGAVKCTAATRYPYYDFTGHPGLANGHIIVGGNDGELYALTLGSLQKAWQWPDKSPEDSLTCIEWGAPAFNGADIYIGHDDESLYKFTDAGSRGIRVAAYGVAASVVDAPVIGADGSVYFGSDSGYLVKIDANLTAPVWRVHLTRDGEVYGPIIGDDGTVYCGTDTCRLHAVNPNGTVKWTATLDGVGMRPALGRSALFVGTDLGTAYSIDPRTGSINWQKSLVHGSGFYTTPIVAANDYVYVSDYDDVLYCLSQADGTLIWVCDCESYLPGGGRSRGMRRPRPMQLTEYDPNPSITSTGDIIVVGYNALYCVNGHKDGPLDGTAAWPKWQKDRSNTGKR